MPLARYFLFVGGVLLALLFISDDYLPKLAVSNRAISHSAIIRIHSDQKWPERVVYDTSLPTAIPAQIANMEASVAVPEIAASATVREREAFAQLQRPDANQPPDPKKREPKLQRQRKKIAKRQAAPAARLVARQPQFGWFGNNMW
jgi:hypothetical protein